MRLSKGVTEGWVLRGLVLAYALGLAAVLFTIFFVGSRSLPDVSFRATGDESSASLNGLLLAHSEGYWYVLVPELSGSGTGGETSGEVGIGKVIPE